MSRLTDKNWLAGKYLLVLLFVWGLCMRVGGTRLPSNDLETSKYRYSRSLIMLLLW